MKIEVFVRHCYYSNVSAHKKRPKGFSHRKCFENFLAMTNFRKVNLTLLLDTHYVKNTPHFVHEQERFPVVEIDAGSETKAFLALLDLVMAKDYTDDTIIYFLEDDYFHRADWQEVMLEGFSLPGIDYLTLFDHRDKYFAPDYQNLTSKLFHTNSCHWRTTPSTTNTYAMRFGTLKKDIATHREYSLTGDITPDHEKFLDLGRQRRVLVSSIPGFSTHAESEFASPCVDWDNLMQPERRRFSFLGKQVKLNANTEV